MKKLLASSVVALALFILMPVDSAKASSFDEQLWLGLDIPISASFPDYDACTDASMGIIFNAEYRHWPFLGFTLDAGYIGGFEKKSLKWHQGVLLFGARYYFDVGPVALYPSFRFGMDHFSVSGPFGAFGGFGPSFAMGLGGGVQYMVYDHLVLDAGIEFLMGDVPDADMSTQMLFLIGARYGLKLF